MEVSVWAIVALILGLSFFVVPLHMVAENFNDLQIKL